MTNDSWDYEISPGISQPVIFACAPPGPPSSEARLSPRLTSPHSHLTSPCSHISVASVADSRKNIDSFTHYHGPTRGFDHLMFIPIEPSEDLTYVMIVVATAVALLLLLSVVELCKRCLRVANVKAARIDRLRKQVNSSFESGGSLKFGMVLVNANHFLAHGHFVPYEKLRDLSELKASHHPRREWGRKRERGRWGQDEPAGLQVLDTLQDARNFARDQTIIFFSHQWLSWDEPDPQNIHFRCMADAVRHIFQGALATAEKTWVWVDYRRDIRSTVLIVPILGIYTYFPCFGTYQALPFQLYSISAACLCVLPRMLLVSVSCSCMPQLNSTTLKLAVSDLAEVAALATYLVVVCPPAVHSDTKDMCDMASYQSRGW